MKEAGDRYTACMSAEAEKNAKSTAGAEDVAIAAHGRCFAFWEAYGKATAASFAYGASTAEERQYARDRTDAHLRQFEIEARQAVMNVVIQSNLPAKR